MNCRTGEITNDSEQIRRWLSEGDRVLLLPDRREMAEFAGQVVPDEKPPSVLAELGFETVTAESAAEKARRRELNNLKLRILAGR